MSKKYIIGIDGGSQSTKVVMYDLQGNVVCEGKGLLQPLRRRIDDDFSKQRNTSVVRSSWFVVRRGRPVKAARKQ